MIDIEYVCDECGFKIVGMTGCYNTASRLYCPHCEIVELDMEVLE